MRHLIDTIRRKWVIHQELIKFWAASLLFVLLAFITWWLQ